MNPNTDSLIIYTSYADKFSMLDDAQFGRVIRGLIEYQRTGAVPKIENPLEEMAFKVALFDLDENNRKYEEKVKARSEAGKKGMQARWKKNNKATAEITKDNKNNNVIPAITSVTNITDNVNDNENVNDNVLNAHAFNKAGDREKAIEAFRGFWNLYPRKEKEDAACRAWISLKPDLELVKTIMGALQANIDRNGSWKRDGGRYIPTAENWLLECRWKDEVREEKTDSKRSSNQFNDFSQRSYTETDYAELEARKLRRGLG